MLSGGDWRYQFEKRNDNIKSFDFASRWLRFIKMFFLTYPKRRIRFQKLPSAHSLKQLFSMCFENYYYCFTSTCYVHRNTHLLQQNIFQNCSIHTRSLQTAYVHTLLVLNSMLKLYYYRIGTTLLRQHYLPRAVNHYSFAVIKINFNESWMSHWTCQANSTCQEHWWFRIMFPLTWPYTEDNGTTCLIVILMIFHQFISHGGLE